MSLWEYPFFGLTDEYNLAVWEQIDSLVRQGYEFMTLYNMPIFRRTFLVRVAIRRAEEEKRQMDKSRGLSEGTPVSQAAAGKVPSFVKNQVSAR